MKTPPKEGSPAEEATESPAEENAEQSSGMETGVTIPEEFQQQAHKLIHKASKHHLSHLRDRISAREDELRKQESKGKKNTDAPEMMSTEGMPS